MIKYFDGNGDYQYKAHQLCVFEVRTTCEFHVVINDRLQGPKTADARFYTKTLQKDDVLDIFCEERYSMKVTELPPRGEVISGESLVEVIEEGELNMYEKLRQEMLGKLSQIAQANDLDLPDDDDFDWEEEDYETPLTPYEYQEMADDTPIQEEPIQNETVPPTEQRQPEETPSDSGQEVN